MVRRTPKRRMPMYLRKMKIPEEFELLSLFESELQFTEDINSVPFFYNQSKYTLENDSNHICRIEICPADDEMKISVTHEKQQISYVEFKNIRTLSILDDKNSRFMITQETAVTKIQLKPCINIFHSEENLL